MQKDLERISAKELEDRNAAVFGDELGYFSIQGTEGRIIDSRMQTGAKWKESLLCYPKNGSGIKIWCKLIVFCLQRSSKPGGKAALCFPGGVVGRARLAAVPWEQAPPLPTARKTSRTGHFGVCPTRATSSDLGEPLTCRHGHGGPRDHAHGHAVGPGRSHGGRVDRRRDAVGLHHGGVMDDVRLRRVHRLGVVSSLLKKGKSREVFLAPGTRRGL